MKTLGFIALVSQAIAPINEAIASPGDAPRAAVEVYLGENRADRVTLRLSVTNLSKSPEEFVTSFLPWGIRDSIVLVAVTDSADAEELPSALPIDDPGPEHTLLQPGQTIRGNIDLVKRFPSLPEMLHKHGVIIFWSYTPWSTDGGDLNRSTGAVIIPKEEGKK
jgi:hypothetical protein